MGYFSEVVSLLGRAASVSMQGPLFYFYILFLNIRSISLHIDERLILWILSTTLFGMINLTSGLNGYAKTKPVTPKNASLRVSTRIRSLKPLLAFHLTNSQNLQNHFFVFESKGEKSQNKMTRITCAYTEVETTSYFLHIHELTPQSIGSCGNTQVQGRFQAGTRSLKTLQTDQKPTCEFIMHSDVCESNGISKSHTLCR